MPNAALTAISANIQWSDGAGPCTIYANNMRFDNWTPDQDDIGPEEVAFGTGLIYKFVERTDYTVTFDLSANPPVGIALLQRLKSWLNKGGGCVVNTLDPNNNSYTCTKKPGFTIAPPKWDSKLLTYTLSLGLKNTASAPMIYLLASRLPPGWTVTVTPSTLTLSLSTGPTGTLTVNVTDPNGNPYPGLYNYITSSNPAVASVNNTTNVVTGLTIGSCIMTTNVGGSTTTTLVTVNA